MKKISCVLSILTVLLVVFTSSAFAAEYKGVYRVYNTTTGEHLFTNDTNEVNTLTIQTVGNSQILQWVFEGARMVHQDDGVPVYRLYNPRSYEHIYTIDENEKNVLTGQYGWQADFGGQPAFKVAGGALNAGEPVAENMEQIHRLFNSKASAAAAHLITSDENEIKVLTSEHGYVDEGIKFQSLTPASVDLNE